jgi:hypothetical protein
MAGPDRVADEVCGITEYTVGWVDIGTVARVPLNIVVYL